MSNVFDQNAISRAPCVIARPLNLIVRVMSRRGFAWLLGCSCLLPVIILASASYPAQLLWSAWAPHLGLFSIYLIAPHLIFGILALTVAPTLLRVALPAVIALNLALFCFLIWTWSLAQHGEGGFASVFYIPVW